MKLSIVCIIVLKKMETIFINSIENIKFTLINLMHETLKLYIPDNDCEYNLLLKVCTLFVNIRLYHEIKLHNRIIFNKKQNLQKFKNIISK